MPWNLIYDYFPTICEQPVPEGNKMAAPLFMGFDSSTQQLKALVIDKDLKVVTEASVHFDNDFPEFKTQGGVHQHKDKLTVTAPTLLWVKAFDLVLKRLKENGLEFGAIACVSGTGQQHGSVYWKNGARETLKNLQSGKSLYDQFQVQGVHLCMVGALTLSCSFRTLPLFLILIN